MTHWKPCAAVFAAFSVLALAGCGHSQDSADGGPGPNANDKAAEANTQKNSPAQAAQAAAAARAASQKGTPQNTPK